jgi:hypothetical protein
MKLIPLFAFHGHFSGRGYLVLLAVLAVLIIIAAWPDKSQTK